MLEQAKDQSLSRQQQTGELFGHGLSRDRLVSACNGSMRIAAISSAAVL
ncbi:hypothetical protein [Paraburkholderia caledonica]|nr:hypothetical protein [Paraburkholderia caledonica]